MTITFINPFMVQPSALPIAVRAWGWNVVNPSTTIVVTIPATAVIGDLLIALVSRSGSGSISWPAGGWTEFEDSSSPGLAYAWKVCVSGDIGANMTITASASRNMAAFVLAIQGYNSASAPVDGTAATGTSTAPDCPANAAHSWGTGVKTLFLAVHSLASSDIADGETPPAGYSQLPGWLAGFGVGRSTAGQRLCVFTKVANATTDNPAAISISISANWRCNTIAVRGLV